MSVWDCSSSLWPKWSFSCTCGQYCQRILSISRNYKNVNTYSWCPFRVLPCTNWYSNQFATTAYSLFLLLLNGFDICKRKNSITSVHTSANFPIKINILRLANLYINVIFISRIIIALYLGIERFIYIHFEIDLKFLDNNKAYNHRYWDQQVILEVNYNFIIQHTSHSSTSNCETCQSA